MDYDAFSQELERCRGGGRRGLALFRRVGSSHDLGRRLLREYAGDVGSVPALDLVAWEQSTGHGQGQRPWSSPPGAGAYVTLVRGCPPLPVQLLPLLVSVALADALNVLLPTRVGLKWPNDLLVDGAKLGGVLVEATSRGSEVCGVVLSFGVNHALAVERFGQPEATSVLALEPKEPVSVAALVVRLAEAVDQRLADPPTVSDLLATYRELSTHRPGDHLAVSSRGEELAGVFAGFDELGFLLLEVEGEEQRISVGDVRARSEEAVSDPSIPEEAVAEESAVEPEDGSPRDRPSSSQASSPGRSPG
ncbi:MAG: biotin--[acetyl-CoA-carboxylase] ligase [Holophagales bacterium]|nr:biotin--[acetyl-CoA-carboxylase] ligase [Holophagales bacterium]